jgi:hypothetical protein
MNELFPILSGLAVGTMLGLIRPQTRLVVAVAAAVVLGTIATVISGEYKIGWEYPSHRHPTRRCLLGSGIRDPPRGATGGSRGCPGLRLLRIERNRPLIGVGLCQVTPQLQQ